MSVYEYIYTREIVDGAYNIDNPKTADVEGLLIHLSSYVQPYIGGKSFILRCVGSEAKFIFDEELTVEEETALTTQVNNYKALTE